MEYDWQPTPALPSCTYALSHEGESKNNAWSHMLGAFVVYSGLCKVSLSELRISYRLYL